MMKIEKKITLMGKRRKGSQIRKMDEMKKRTAKNQKVKRSLQ